MEAKRKKLAEDKHPFTAEPIAIIGMSCRFPQAPTLDAFWKLLRSGQDTVSEIPAERWNVENYYDPDPTARLKTNQRHGSMLEHIHDFDPLFFSISPAEAVEMNPSQKLMLELTWEAIENSGIRYKDVHGKKAGVYVGNIWSDFEHHRKHKNAPVTSHSAMGQSSNIIANRISFTFGFTGPSLVVDTGCSSSLVAIHLACQSLWDDSTEMAFAAGVNHILDPDQYILLSKFGGLSSTGKCNTFDSDADGFVRGEGGGVLMLKKLSHAERDGDTIFALIRGSAINNNGYNASLPATSVEGQKQMLTDAYRYSGIAPHEVHYVEAHGTGTKLGDPTEARALGEFFREGRKKNKLRIGSVKTNIGHLEGAAGMAGLIKVVLAMHNKELPASLNYKTPNPAIPFDELKLSVQDQLGSWPSEQHESLKAGINSFGWGGTNAHTVIEEYRSGCSSSVNFIPDRCCLPLSAKSTPALKEYARAYVQSFQTCSENNFKDICTASAIVKPSFDHRVLFSANEKSEMIKALEDFINDPGEILCNKSYSEENKVVMIFPGQGSQWIGMGQELYKLEPVFREAINECNETFTRYTDWSLLEQLHASDEDSLQNEIHVIQPMLFAMQISLARLWLSWGIRPHAVVGHSMGEVAAAYISGALCLDDAARIICTRSKLMRTVSGQGGAMAMTELSFTEAESLVKCYPQLSVAASNSPKSTVLAGDKEAMLHALAELESRDLFCRLVKVDVASHSKQMDSLKEHLREALQSINPLSDTIPVYSTVSGLPINGEDLNPDYWVNNLRSTVQFNAAVDQLLKSGHTIFIEVSPHPVLTNAVNECAQHAGTNAVTIASLYREKPEQESIYKNLGELYANGYDINWEIFYHRQKAPMVQLPPYPFQRMPYELEDKSTERSFNTSARLLGSAIHLADSETLCFWEASINLGSFPYLRDHQINGSVVLPGAVYVEMALEAAHEIYHSGTPVISQLRFIKSVTLSQEDAATIQLKFIIQDKVNVFKFFVKSTKETGKATWELLAKGELKIHPTCAPETRSAADDLTFNAISGRSFYESLLPFGLQYGPYFQGINRVLRRDGLEEEVHFSVTVGKQIQASSNRYKIHPALLDSFFQPLFCKAIDEKQNSCTSFLTEITELHQCGPVDQNAELHGVAILKQLKKDDLRGLTQVEADVDVYNNDGSHVLRIKGLKGKIIDTGAVEQRKEKLNKWLYSVQWIKSEKTTIAHEPQEAWVVFGDPYGVSGILIDKMKKQNIPCIHVTPGSQFLTIADDHYTICYSNKEDYGKLMTKLFLFGDRKVAGILHAGSMSYTWQDPYLTADRVEEQQAYGSISFMYLHQQLEKLKLDGLPKLIILTNGIQAIGQEHEVAQPVHSPLWGMVKVMFNELTQYHFRYFDLSANPAMIELDRVVSELQNSQPSENEIVFRGNDQYVPRLRVLEHEDHSITTRRQFCSSGTYLITGFRGLGFVFIEWMIRQGARNFALVSRTGEASQDVAEKISILETQGCRFNIFKADTGNYNELRTALKEIESSMTELKGVVHAAGVIEARKLTDLDPGEFLRILNPKVKGAWNLHLLTQKKPLDCFIMFSSASTLIGISGQGSYVAANAFLDTLAHSRRRMGLPGMSVNWGVMKDVGMVANQSELERYARAEGFEPVTMRDAMEVFNLIYDHEYTQIGIVKLNAESVANHYTSLGQTRYFNGLLQKEQNVAKADRSFVDHFVSLTTKQDQIAALEQLVIQQVAQVVKTSPSQIKLTTTFKALGIDSLMAIQLWNLLERNLSIKLSLAMFWSHPSIGQYIESLHGLLNEKLAAKKTINMLQDKAPAESKTNEWFVVPKPKPLAKFRIFCFHDAGGNASLYHEWANLFGNHFEVVAVELPGRSNRATERPYTDLSLLIQDLLPVIGPLLHKPFYFFGHSMGGLVAFELTRMLRRTNHNLPRGIFISSTPGLTTYSRREVDHTLDEYEMIDLFPHLEKKKIGDDSLHHLLLNLLRADLELLNNYRYAAEEALPVPLVVIYGTDDARVKSDQAEQWQHETTSTFNLIPRPGGHRYIEDDAEFLTSLIQKNAELAENKIVYERVH